MADSKISALSDGSPLVSTDALAIARSGTSLKVLGSGLPGAELTYNQITSSVNVVSTAIATPTTIITCSAYSFDGTPVMLEFYSDAVQPPTSGTSTNNYVGICLSESGTTIAQIAFLRPNGTTGFVAYVPCLARFRFTPSAASHTYVISAYVGSTSGTPLIGAGNGASMNDVPAYARITRA